MFNSKYTISPKLLSNIKKVTQLVTNLNNLSFPKVVLMRLEREALALSSKPITKLNS